MLSSYSLALIAATPVSWWLAQMIGLRWLFVLSFIAYACAAIFVAFVPRKRVPEDAMAVVRY